MMEKLLRTYLRLKCVFIREKELRRDYRDNYKARRLETKMKKQKWGVAYSVFDGEELLEASVRNIRPHVDYICVVWQRISWYGVPVHEGLRPLMMRLKEQGLVDEVLEYEVDLKLRAGKNETRKRNMGLKAARKAGCTYFMAIDTDEFYKPEEMESAKKYIVENKITHSYCAQNVYGSEPTQLILATVGCCPFFSRLTRWSKHRNDPHSIARVDPTRKMSYLPWWCGGNKHFFLHMVRMNHFSFIRKDLLRKLDNSSGGNAYEKTDERLKKCEQLQCPDWFGIKKVMDEFR